ncbi:MAG: hypothetical protein WCK82_12845 [Bacteroidota bacterium]
MIRNISIYWSFSLFSGLIGGAYILGKYGELNGILSLWKVVILGTIFPCLIMCYLSLNVALITYSSTVLFLRFMNAFFHPATLFISIIFLMKMYHPQLHVKISAYFIFATLLSMQCSYCAITYYSANNLKLWCCLFLAISVLAGFTWTFFFKEIKIEAQEIMLKTTLTATIPGAKSLAFFIGYVFNAGIRYHYFFADAYINDVLILKYHPFTVQPLRSIFFYIFLNMFLIIASYLIKPAQQLRFLTLSLMGILLIGIMPIALPICSLITYEIYQGVFAFFLAGFLAPSLSIIFLLFNDSKQIFNRIFWFTLGYGLSNLAGDWLTIKYGFFHRSNLLPMMPFICGGAFCLVVLRYNAPKLEQHLREFLNKV